MLVKFVENTMYQLSDFFLLPVLASLLFLLAYALFALGKFACQFAQRKKNKKYFNRVLQLKKNDLDLKNLQGYPLLAIAQLQPDITKDELDVAALEELEGTRTVSRLAPMLGLIATMIPMGPALKSLSDGNIQGISENLIVAFSAVIFGLVIASITFWIASIKKRWLAAELVAAMPYTNKPIKITSREIVREAA